MKKCICLIAAVFLIESCNSSRVTNVNVADFTALYSSALTDAIHPDSGEIYRELIAVSDSNPDLVRTTINNETYVLVVTWKSQEVVSQARYKEYPDSSFFNTGKWEMWVTVAPELLNRMKNIRYDEPNVRLKQLLGLPPNAQYDYFVEFWVKPGDLFRPCPDSEVTDRSCELCCPAAMDSSYRVWFEQCKSDRYSGSELFKKYPWTQLGYTYDWNGETASHIGLSEFVVKKNSSVRIRRVCTTAEYIKETCR